MVKNKRLCIDFWMSPGDDTKGVWRTKWGYNKRVFIPSYPKYIGWICMHLHTTILGMGQAKANIYCSWFFTLIFYYIVHSSKSILNIHYIGIIGRGWIHDLDDTRYYRLVPRFIDYIHDAVFNIILTLYRPEIFNFGIFRDPEFQNFICLSLFARLKQVILNDVNRNSNYSQYCTHVLIDTICWESIRNNKKWCKKAKMV